MKHIKQFFLECKSSTLTSVTFLSLYSACQKTVRFGTKAATHRGPQIWNSIPDDIKNVSSLENFTREIKKWKGEKCLCRICKTSALSKHKRCSTSKAGSFLWIYSSFRGVWDEVFAKLLTVFRKAFRVWCSSGFWTCLSKFL